MPACEINQIAQKGLGCKKSPQWNSCNHTAILPPPSTLSSHWPPIHLSIISQALRSSWKAPNWKSAARNTNGKVSQHSSHTKENLVNQATTTATPMLSKRRSFKEVTIEANNVEDMAQKILEMQGEPTTWLWIKDRSSTHWMHQPWLVALKKAEADKESLAQ